MVALDDSWGSSRIDVSASLISDEVHDDSVPTDPLPEFPVSGSPGSVSVSVAGCYVVSATDSASGSVDGSGCGSGSEAGSGPGPASLPCWPHPDLGSLELVVGVPL